MSTPSPKVLGLTERVLQILILLNLLLGAGILALFAASLIDAPWLLRMLGARADAGAAMVWGMRAVMAIGMISVPLAHAVLARLRAMVGKVRTGDAFVSSNAERLRGIGWALLALELLHILVGIVGALASTAADPIDLDWNFSVSGWLAVLLAFVLARVFEEGARMREDLEGTV
jgi:hypothetical protein